MKTYVIPAMKVDNVSISGVIQIGESKAVLPYLDTFASGGPRGAESFNTQYFPRTRTRIHFANQTDDTYTSDLDIVSPVPNLTESKEIWQRWRTGNDTLQQFAEDGHRFQTSTSQPVHLGNLRVISILSSAVLHVGNTQMIASVVHSETRGLLRGTVVGVGGPVGAIR
jgi:hypothetical protein